MFLTAINDTGEIVQQASITEVVTKYATNPQALVAMYHSFRDYVDNAPMESWQEVMGELSHGFRVNRVHKLFHQFAAADAVLVKLERAELITDSRRRSDRRNQIWVSASDALGIEPHTLQNMVDVAKAYPPEERIYDVPFAFYDELRAEDVGLRNYLLDRAANSRPVWTRDRLRAERRQLAVNGQLAASNGTEYRDDKTNAIALAELGVSETPDNEEPYDSDAPASGNEISNLIASITAAENFIIRCMIKMARNAGRGASEEERNKYIQTAIRQCQDFSNRMAENRRQLEQLL